MACKDSTEENTGTDIGGIELESNHGKKKKFNFIKGWMKYFRSTDDYGFFTLKVDPDDISGMEETKSDISGEEIDWYSKYMEDQKDEKEPISSGNLEDRILTLTEKMNSIKEELRNSNMYHKILHQWKNDPAFKSNIDRLLKKPSNDYSKMLMVIYALGSIESDSTSRYQLALAILLKEDFPDWISSIESYDPITTTIDAKVMEDLGITVLSENENGARRIEKPTLFYMPFAMHWLKSNLFVANSQPPNLNQILLLTSSCKYVLDVNRLNIEDNPTKTTFWNPYPYPKNYYENRPHLDCMEALQNHTVEFRFRRPENRFPSPFEDFAFHFFNLPPDKDLFDLLEGVPNRGKRLKIYDRIYEPWYKTCHVNFRHLLGLSIEY